MIYKRIQDIPFPWEFEELQKLPIFFKEEVYKQLDEFIEEEKKLRSSIENGAARF